MWAERFAADRTSSPSQQTGIAWMPEGTGRDPAAFELFTELAWRPDRLDLEGWFSAYAGRRYGGRDQHALAAWQALARTAYSMPPGEWGEAQNSLFAARPALTLKRAVAGPDRMRYDAAILQSALGELLAVAPPLRTTDSW